MAQEAKHTPGPWEFDGDNAVMAEVGAHICTVSTADDFPCLDQDEETQADVQRECEANGRLIAASPKLLEAVKGLLSSLVGEEFADDIPAVSFARAVIADVEGQP